MVFYAYNVSEQNAGIRTRIDDWIQTRVGRLIPHIIWELCGRPHPSKSGECGFDSSQSFIFLLQSHSMTWNNLTGKW